jgi:hypothetical protein
MLCHLVAAVYTNMTGRFERQVSAVSSFADFSSVKRNYLTHVGVNQLRCATVCVGIPFVSVPGTVLFLWGLKSSDPVSHKIRLGTPNVRDSTMS